MCDPVTATVIASAAYGLYATNKAAKSSERQARAAQAEQEKQIHASKSAAVDDRQRRMRRERARLHALSSETGLSGITSDTVLNNVDFQAGFDIAQLNLQTEFDTTASRYQLQSNLNRIEQPDFIGTALNTGLQLYSVNQDTKAAQDGTG